MKPHLRLESLGRTTTFKAQQLVDGLPFSPEETVSSVASYQSNLYIGTSSGQLLHYHSFEDAPDYLLISQLPIGSGKPVKKILVLADIERALVLSGSTIHVVTLPELSPSHVGKVKDANDMLLLQQIRKTAPNPGQKPQPPNEKVVVYTPSKIRLLQFSHDNVKLLKDINYTDAQIGVSCAAGTSSNYSNLCLVANGSNYDIVDMQQTRKIPLFEYNAGGDPVRPFIVPFAAHDKKGKEEYLLTVNSDRTTSMAMFINSVGDVTRGTLSWIDEGYPSNGLVVSWPYTLGLFSKPGKHSILNVSSLVTFDVVYSKSVFELLGKGDILEDALERTEDQENAPEKAEDQENALERVEDEENAPEKTVDEQNAPAGETFKGPSTTAKSLDDKTEIGALEIPAATEGKAKQDLEEHENADGPEETKETQSTEEPKEIQPADTIKSTLSTETDKETLFSEATDLLHTTQKETEPSAAKAPKTTEETTTEVPEIRISQLPSTIPFSNSLFSSLLQDVGLIEETTVTNTQHTSGASIILHDEQNLWVLYEEEPLVELHERLIEAFQRLYTDTKEIQNISNEFKSLVKETRDEYKNHISVVLMLINVFLEEYTQIRETLLTDVSPLPKTDPRIVLYLLTDDFKDEQWKSFLVHKGIKDLLEIVKKRPVKDDNFLRDYVRETYLKFDQWGFDKLMKPLIRSIWYEISVNDSESLIANIDTEAEMWKETNAHSDNILRNALDQHLYFGALHIYILRSSSKDSGKSKSAHLISDLCLNLLKKELEDSKISLDNSYGATILSHTFNLPDIIFSQLKSEFDDSNDYTKYLLEMLRLFPQKGIDFLKANKNNAHKETHKQILKDISKSHDGTAFLNLKIEYLEAGFLEHLTNHETHSIQLLDELLIELLKCLTGEELSSETNKINLGILQDTFRIENALSTLQWPKIAWIDYVRINGVRSECKDLIEVYLKVYELLLMRSFLPKEEMLKELKLSYETVWHDPLFAYFRLACDKEMDVLNALLMNCDFKSAEFFVIYQKLPLPSKTCYIHQGKAQVSNFYTENSRDSIKEAIERIVDYYALDKWDHQTRVTSISHVVASYGKAYFSPIEVLNLVPQYMPVAFVQEYLTSVLIDYEVMSRESILKKVLSRADAKFNERLYKDFEKGSIK